jgi:hypothetical protein
MLFFCYLAAKKSYLYVEVDVLLKNSKDLQQKKKDLEQQMPENRWINHCFECFAQLHILI